MKRSNDQPNDGSKPRPEALAKELEDALGLWVQDARRQGASADPAATEKGVLARIASDPTGRAYLPQRVSFGYAAAAVVLLAVGLAGSWLAGGSPQAPETVTPDLEQGHLALLRLVELDQFQVGR